MVKISFYTQATEFLVLSFRSENRPQMKNQYTCRYSYINFRSGPMENKKNEHFLSQKIPAIQHIVGLCSASSTHYHFQFGLKNLFTSRARAFQSHQPSTASCCSEIKQCCYYFWLKSLISITTHCVYVLINTEYFFKLI